METMPQRVARYTDGTVVREGDAIRYRQAPGGLLPSGDWMTGVAAQLPADQRARLTDAEELYLLAEGRYYYICGHLVERVQ